MNIVRPALWQVKEFLQAPCRLAGTPWDEVEEAVRTYHAQVWGVCNPHLIAGFATKVTEEACDVWLAGGSDVRNWFAAAETAVSAFARQHGNDRLRIIGRRGWKRVLPHWELTGNDGDLVILELRI